MALKIDSGVQDLIKTRQESEIDQLRAQVAELKGLLVEVHTVASKYQMFFPKTAQEVFKRVGQKLGGQ